MATPGVVWAKVGRTWWPAQVTEDFPSDVTDSCRKTPLAVVKFFNENAYEVIMSANNMIEYRDEKRVDLIKKGLVHLKGVNSQTEKAKFITDLKHAETLTGGKADEIDELSKSVDAPVTPKRPLYADIFKPAPKETPPPATPPSASIKFNFKKTPKPSASPKKDSHSSATPQKPGPPKKYACDICGFSSDRVGVMTSHRKIHSSADYVSNSSGSPRKYPVVSAVNDAVSPSTSGTNTKVSPIKPKIETPKIEVKDKVSPVKRGRKKKVQAKEDILNDWSDEEVETPLEKPTEDIDETSAPLMKKPRTDKELADAFNALLESTRPPTIDKESKEIIKEEPPAKPEPHSDETNTDDEQKNVYSPLPVQEKDSNITDHKDLDTIDEIEESSVSDPLNTNDEKADDQDPMDVETTDIDQNEEEMGERTDLEELKEIPEINECVTEENASDNVEQTNDEMMEISYDQSKEIIENIVELSDDIGQDVKENESAVEESREANESEDLEEAGESEEVKARVEVKESGEVEEKVEGSGEVKDTEKVEESTEAKDTEEVNESEDKEESISSESVKRESSTENVARGVGSDCVMSDVTPEECMGKESETETEQRTEIKEIVFESTELDKNTGSVEEEFNNSTNAVDASNEDADTEPEEEDFAKTLKHSEAELETTTEKSNGNTETFEKMNRMETEEHTAAVELSIRPQEIETISTAVTSDTAPPVFTKHPQPTFISAPNPTPVTKGTPKAGSRRKSSLATSNPPYQVFAKKSEVEFQIDEKTITKKDTKFSRKKAERESQLEKQNHLHEPEKTKYREITLYEPNSAVKTLSNSEIQVSLNGSSLTNLIPESNANFQSFEEKTIISNAGLQPKPDDFAARLDAIIAVVDSVQRTDAEPIVSHGSSEQHTSVAIREPAKKSKPQTDSSTHVFPKDLPIAIKSAPVLLESPSAKKDATGKPTRKATKREPKSAAAKATSLAAAEKNADKKVYSRKKSNPISSANKPVVAESIPPKEPMVNIKGVEKPTATIRPTLNIEDDSIIRQALQGTIKSSPESQSAPNSRSMEIEVEGERSIVAIEEGGGTKVAEQVVHLVPVENPDGTVTYMLLSLGGQGELCIDAAEGAAPTIEEGAIFMDKTTDADTFFASITQPNAPTSIVQTTVSQKMPQPYKQTVVSGATHSNANNQVMLQNQLQGVQILQSNQPSNELIQITQQVEGGSLIEVAGGSSGATQTITSGAPAMLDLASLISGTGGAQIQSGEQQLIFVTEDGSIINPEGFNLSDFMISS